MSEADVVIIHCSRCRARIPVRELSSGEAVSVGQYCFCKRCLDKKEVEEIRRIRKLSASERRHEWRKKAVFFDRG